MNSDPIAIVIVNYKGYKDTFECLNSIRNIYYPNFHVIVVDNFYNEANFKKIKSSFPKFFFIKSKNNLGFTGGNNLGFKKAYEIGAKYILCLNNDTIVSNNILLELSSFMNCNPKYGLIGPLTLYHSSPGTISFAGGYINRNSGLIRFIHKGRNLPLKISNITPCTFVEGSALFIRSDLIKDIGGFNEDYFLTSEESELCIKVADMGYKVGVLNTCFIWHKVSQSMVKASELSSYFIFRNKLYFVKNNSTKIEYFEIVQYYLICILSFIKNKNFSALKGLLYGVFDYYTRKKGAGRFANRLHTR